MFRDALYNFPAQFAYEPVIENVEYLKPFDKVQGKFIVCGMGGSHLAADILKIWKPELDLFIHSDYGLPAMAEGDLRERLLILSSYSGNTEEVIDAFLIARKKSLATIVISIGGKLIELAQESNIPYIRLPDAHVEPRMALGLSLRAFLKAIGEEDAFNVTGGLAQTLNARAWEERGKELAFVLRDSVPVVYASRRNYGVAYNWKIKFNETGKTPAFMNVFPELNHNEMNGFDVADATRALSENFHFIFLKDDADDPRIKRRTEILEKLYEDRGVRVKTLMLEGQNVFQKVFSSLIFADWTAFYIADRFGLETEKTPMIAEFKELIK